MPRSLPTLAMRVQSALAKARERFGFRLIHFSVQRDHLDLIAEASDRRALSRGVPGLTIRVARAVNRYLQRAGRLFADRYHARALRTPRSAFRQTAGSRPASRFAFQRPLGAGPAQNMITTAPQRGTRSSTLLQDFEQLELVHERSARRAGSAAVGELLGDPEQRLVPFAH